VEHQVKLELLVLPGPLVQVERRGFQEHLDRLDFPEQQDRPDFRVSLVRLALLDHLGLRERQDLKELWATRVPSDLRALLGWLVVQELLEGLVVLECLVQQVQAERQELQVHRVCWDQLDLPALRAVLVQRGPLAQRGHQAHQAAQVPQAQEVLLELLECQACLDLLVQRVHLVLPEQLVLQELLVQ